MATHRSRPALAAIASVFQPSTGEWPIMPPAFVITFTVLMLFGPWMAMLAAAAAAVAPALLIGPVRRGPMLVDTVIVVTATWGAGLAYESAGGLSGLRWPWQAVPIAAAVLVYHVVQGALASVVVPLVLRRRIDRSWPSRALEGCAIYLLGAEDGGLPLQPPLRPLPPFGEIQNQPRLYLAKIVAPIACRDEREPHASWIQCSRP